jgi:starch synthase
MRILLASSEVHPYSKTGGLADMVGALAKALAHNGHHVGVVTPLYAGIRERFPGLRRMDLPLDLPLGVERIQGDVWALDLSEQQTIYFVDQPGYYQRAGLYQAHGADYPDNAERFIFFSKAVAHLAQALPWKPEIAHLNDWQAGLAALLLRHERRKPGCPDGPATCMTLHNLAYQGLFPAAQFALTNLPWGCFNAEGPEFYGQMSLLKAGIVFADVLTTVSPRYAREITTPEFGCGLDGLLRHRQASLTGILNGVDYEEWKTLDNPYLGQGYSAADLSGKLVNKLALQSEFGLPVEPQTPLFGNIGRMADQKGVDIQYGALQEMLSENLQVIMLGTGTPALEQALTGLAKRFPDRLSVRIGFDEGLSHRIEAGADFFLMPSRFEPCGLNQLYSLRYGTVPIVRATGGLDDTVVDVTENVENANGIKFKDYSAAALAKAMRKALALYGEPELLERFRQNGMAADFSWDRLAGEYLKIYRQAIKAAKP